MKLPSLLATLATCTALAAQAAELAEVRTTLERPILDPGRSLADVQAYCEARVPVMPKVRGAGE